MAQMPAPAPVSWVLPKSLRMCTRKEQIGGNTVSECAVRGRVRSAAARDDSEAQPDAQDCKLRELADHVWNGADDLVDAQVPAKVRAEGVRRGESAVSERCA